MIEKQFNILHLLSWFPTPDDPTKGNFCLRHIEAIARSCPSVVLTVYQNANIQNKRILSYQVVENYTHVTIQIKSSRCFISTLGKIINKYRIFKAYNLGLKYIKKNIFIPDLVHLHVALPVGKIALYWKYRYKLPYLLSEHWTVYQTQDNRLTTKKIKNQLRSIINNAIKVSAVSGELQKSMNDFDIKETIHIIPNVIDTTVFTLKNFSKNEILQILHVSSLNDYQKNFSGILRGINRLKTIRKDFVLNVIHDYDYEAYKPYIEENNLAEFVVFHGKKSVEELVKHYQTADFLIMFSNFETFSCVVMESLACGTPVVATKTGAIPEMLANERGIVILPGDEEALFQAMNTMLDTFQSYSPEKLRQFVLENYDSEIVGEKFYQLYQSLLNY